MVRTGFGASLDEVGHHIRDLLQSVGVPLVPVRVSFCQRFATHVRTLRALSAGSIELNDVQLTDLLQRILFSETFLEIQVREPLGKLALGSPLVPSVPKQDLSQILSYRSACLLVVHVSALTHLNHHGPRPFVNEVTVGEIHRLDRSDERGDEQLFRLGRALIEDVLPRRGECLQANTSIDSSITV